MIRYPIHGDESLVVLIRMLLRCRHQEQVGKDKPGKMSKKK